MTEEKIQEASKDSAVASKKKKKFSLTRVIILFVIIFSGYCGLRYFEIKQAKKSNSKVEIGNVESEIFDLAEEYKNSDTHDQHALSDIPLNEVQEKGAEFIYKMLLRNQAQINDLKNQSELLKTEFTKYKSQEKIGKIIFSYIEFRQKLLAGDAFEDDLKNFEMRAIFDKNLQDKISKLRVPLKSFVNEKKLSKEFSDLIPELITTKNHGVEDGLFSKICRNISKLVIVRRIDGKNPNDVDGIIVRTEKLLREENYQEAFNCLLTLDQSYHEILVNFLNELNAAAEVKKIDSEILSYLKTLS
jgi:hypothetical protein